MLNENRLRGKIAEKRLSFAAVSKHLGIDAVTFHRKLTGKNEFNRDEIYNLKTLLELSDSETMLIFFS